jgi:hypothetical protein
LRHQRPPPPTSVCGHFRLAILGRNVLLDGAGAVGLTDDSPDYSVSISLPIRFSTPGF